MTASDMPALRSSADVVNRRPPAVSSFRRIGAAVAVTVAGLAAAGALVGTLSAGRWPWVVASYLRLPQTAAAVVAALALLALRRWTLAAGASGIAVTLAVTVVVPWSATAAETVPHRDGLRVAVFNTGPDNNDINAIAATVADADADVVVLLESGDVAGQVDAALPDLQRLETAARQPAPRESGAPVVLARQPWPLVVEPLGDGRPAAVATVAVDGRPLDVVAVHPLPPVTRRWAASHDASIAALVGEVLPRPRPWIVAGDLNTTVWTPSMDRLRAAGLRAPTVAATFGLPVVGLPLDHVLLGPATAATARELGSFAGSDHRLLVVEVVVRSAPDDEPSR